jgi:hypothetical protein
MRRKTVYCVQAYKRSPRGLERINLLQFTSATEAEEVCGKLSSHVAGVLIYALEGDPDTEIWGEPERWSFLGEVPEMAD